MYSRVFQFEGLWRGVAWRCRVVWCVLCALCPYRVLLCTGTRTRTSPKSTRARTDVLDPRRIFFFWCNKSAGPEAGNARVQLVRPGQPCQQRCLWSTSLSDYSLCERIGRGAFADVYRAEVAGRSDGSAIALKVMDMEKIGSQVDDDIRAEVLTMKSCNHPNVLGCFACFTSRDAKLYLVMPYMDRGSALHVMKRLKREGKRAAGLSKGWVKYIIGEVLKGLQYLHDNKLIHRDIKAGNILLNSRGDVKIADFGTTTFMQERGKDRQHATFTGTVCWMAPEVMAQEEGYSYPADVWSIGITTLELVKGYAPYAMYAPMKVLVETLQKPPPTIKSYADEQGRKSKLSGTEWASKSSSFKKFVSRASSVNLPIARPLHLSWG